MLGLALARVPDLHQLDGTNFGRQLRPISQQKLKSHGPWELCLTLDPKP